MASWTQHGCKVCNRDDHDPAGNLKHEAWCPHFMRGPDAGGDPYEWPTLLGELEPLTEGPTGVAAFRSGRYR